MTIVEVTAAPFAEGHSGGGERHVAEFSRELARHESVVTSFGVPTAGGAYDPATIPLPAHVLSWPPVLTETNPLPRWSAVARIGRYLRDHRGEVEFVHLHNLRTAVSSLWLALTYLRKQSDRTRVILTDHGARFVPLPGVLVRAVDLYAPVSAASERYLRDLAERPSCIVPTAVSDGFLAGPPPSFEARPTDLLFVGRMVPWKRPDRVLELAHALGKRLGRPVSAALAGAPSDPAYLAELRRLADQLGLRDQVRFVIGPSDVELRRCYDTSRIFCLASDGTDARGRRYAFPELSPITALEAAARGLPTLAQAIPAAREQVREGITGHLTEHFVGADSLEWAATVLAGGAAWRSYSTGARAFVERERTYPRTVERFRGLLATVRGTTS